MSSCDSICASQTGSGRTQNYCSAKFFSGRLFGGWVSTWELRQPVSLLMSLVTQLQVSCVAGTTPS